MNKHTKSIQTYLNNPLYIVILVVVLFIFGSVAADYQRWLYLPTQIFAPKIEMGTVEINVPDPEVMETFYTQLLGMKILAETSDSLTLGFDKKVLVKFHKAPHVSNVQTEGGELDQLAIVYNSRAGLAKAMQRVLTTSPQIFAGSTNRLVSEAFYVTDPLGYSIELYYDTDPWTWPRRYGKIRTNQLPLDPTQYIQQYANQNGDLGMKIGHLQTNASDIAKARHFYVDLLGLHVESETAESLFLSDGYYHHDLVINKAASPPSSIQPLRSFKISLPNVWYVRRLKERLSKDKISFTDKEDLLSFKDPWGTQIYVTNLGKWWVF